MGEILMKKIFASILFIILLFGCETRIQEPIAQVEKNPGWSYAYKAVGNKLTFFSESELTCYFDYYTKEGNLFRFYRNDSTLIAEWMPNDSWSMIIIPLDSNKTLNSVQ
jgi:hypothetical protein